MKKRLQQFLIDDLKKMELHIRREMREGDTITVIRKDEKKYKGKVEKLNPLKLRTDSTFIWY